MLDSSDSTFRRQSSDVSRLDNNSNSSNSEPEVDDYDDDSSVESTESYGWFVCPCFQPKYKKSLPYKQLDNDSHRQKGEQEEEEKQEQGTMDSSVPLNDSFDGPMKRKTGFESSSSLTVTTAVEEESWSSSSFTSDEDGCDEDENDFRPQVRFGSVEVRQYSLVIGDHYSCKQYPMSLDWSYAESETMSVDEHESEQHARKERRMSSSNFIQWFTSAANTQSQGQYCRSYGITKR
jgi:hypothetical protein